MIQKLMIYQYLIVYKKNIIEMKKFNEFINEANIKDNEGLPKEYVKDIEKRAGEKGELTRITHQEMQEMGMLVQTIMQLQNNNEEKLTEIGKNLIMKYYGNILDNIGLDIKIVKFDDEEKLEMTKEMEDTEEENEEESEPIEIQKEEVDKRKIINILMQGEAQNIHSMIFDAKEELDKINPELISKYMRFLELNRKFDWNPLVSLKQAITEQPEFANAMKTGWNDKEHKPKTSEELLNDILKSDSELEENNEVDDFFNGDGDPYIKVRVLDLPMLLHETVKGIYELIASAGIPEDKEKAQKILASTDSLEDEQEDIKYAPYIAADLRNYINKLFPLVKGTSNIQNLREFVFGKMVILPAKEFVELIKGIILNTNEAKNKMLNLINDAVDEATEPQETTEYDDEDILLKPKVKDYSEMSKNELGQILDQALEKNDFETIKKIQKYL
jgi:hypothetical protein